MSSMTVHAAPPRAPNDSRPNGENSYHPVQEICGTKDPIDKHKNRCALIAIDSCALDSGHIEEELQLLFSDTANRHDLFAPDLRLKLSTSRPTQGGILDRQGPLRSGGNSVLHFFFAPL
jgi:hypothetical protein